MTSMVRTAADILADLQPGRLPVEATGQPAVIRWEDPPPRDPRGGSRFAPPPQSKYAALAAELRARPGRWALIFAGTKNKATSLATIIRLGQVPPFVRGFEAVKRAVDGRSCVYARYIGDEG